MFLLEDLVKFLVPYLSKNVLFDRPLVLFIGPTGAGKSTTINYLLGCEFEFGEGGNAVLARGSKPMFAHAADSGSSVTSYPEVFVPKLEGPEHMQFNLCDCPGLGDTGSSMIGQKEKQVGISICSDLVINKSKSIRSIAVVIEYSTLQAKRCDPFLELMASVGRIVQNLETNSQSIFFIFNRLPLGVTKSYLLKKLHEALKFLEEDLQKKQNILLDPKRRDLVGPDLKLEIEQLQKAIGALKMLIQTSESNIILLDVFDKGESRKNLLARFLTCKDVRKGDISFSGSENSFLEFEDLLMQHIKKYQELHAQYTLQSDKQATIERRLSHHEFLISELISKLARHKSLPPSRDRDPLLVELKLKITNTERLIDFERSRVSDNTKLLKQYESELEALETGESVVFKTLEGIDFRGILGNDTIYSYNDIPYTDITHSGGTGNYIVRQNDSLRGRYDAIYKRGYFDRNSEYPTVTVWVEKRFHPVHQARILELKKLIGIKEIWEIGEGETKIKEAITTANSLNQKFNKVYEDLCIEHQRELSALESDLTSRQKEATSLRNDLISIRDTIKNLSVEKQKIVQLLKPLQPIVDYIFKNGKTKENLRYIFSANQSSYLPTALPATEAVRKSMATTIHERMAAIGLGDLF